MNYRQQQQIQRLVAHTPLISSSLAVFATAVGQHA